MPKGKGYGITKKKPMKKRRIVKVRKVNKK